MAQADPPPKPADAPLRNMGEPESLRHARRLADELRYEEAVVEYQRYLGLADRPRRERAQAIFELAFISLVLGDEVTARARAMEALELDTELRPPPNAPRKWTEFLERMQAEHSARVNVELLANADDEHPEQVRVRLRDPRGKVVNVRLRHGLSAQGPFHSTSMRCERSLCEASIPPPAHTKSYTAYYFVEAVDAEENTLATGASPKAPVRVTVLERAPWYQSPWVWAGGGLGVVAAGAVLFFTSAPRR